LLWIGSRQQERLAHRELEQLTRAHAESESRAAAMETQNSALRAQLEANGVRPVVAAPPPRSAASSSSVEAVRRLALTERQLSDTKAALQSAQNRVLQLESATEQLQGDAKRLSAASNEAREEADGLRRINEAMEAELKSKGARADASDAVARRAQSDAADARQKFNQTAAALRELDDLARRRDGYLNGLLRRYRDANDQLRGLASRLDRARDSGAAPNFSSDVSRLQSLVQAADEDLRQVQSLNGQAARITKGLPQR
jgi:chromosome segregation ATPase